MSPKPKVLTRKDLPELADRKKPEGLRIMRRFRRAVEAGETPSPEDMKALAVMFGEVDAGVPPKKALKLETGRGRKAWMGAKERARREVIAFQVLEEYDQLNPATLKHGEAPLEEVMRRIAERHHVSPRTVQRYYNAHKETAYFVRAFFQRHAAMDPDNK